MPPEEPPEVGPLPEPGKAVATRVISAGEAPLLDVGVRSTGEIPPNGVGVAVIATGVALLDGVSVRVRTGVAVGCRGVDVPGNAVAVAVAVPGVAEGVGVVAVGVRLGVAVATGVPGVGVGVAVAGSGVAVAADVLVGRGVSVGVAVGTGGSSEP